MQIKRDPISRLWCRSDGAVLMPPTGRQYKSFRWTFGSNTSYGYKQVGYRGKTYFVHQMVCRSFNGLPPEDKPFVDHIDRCKTNNTPSNLRWVNHKENCNNKDCVDQSIERYKVRCCDDKQAYNKAYYEAHREEHSTYCKTHRDAHRGKYRAYYAAKAAKMKAKGLTYRKGPDGKWGWFPLKRSSSVPNMKNS